MTAEPIRSPQKSFNYYCIDRRKTKQTKGRSMSAQNYVFVFLKAESTNIVSETVMSAARMALRSRSSDFCTLQVLLKYLKYAKKMRQRMSIVHVTIGFKSMICELETT